MRLKNIHIIVLAGMIGILMVGAVVMAFVQQAGAPPAGERKVRVYYRNADTDTLSPEDRYIKEDTNGAMAQSVLNLLYEGPKSAGLKSVMSANVNMQSGRLMDDTVLELEFTSAYNDMSPIDEIFFRSALVWSLTDLPFIKQVHIYVEGRELMTGTNKPMGLLDRTNVLLNPVVSPDKIEPQKVKLYFSNADRTALAPEERVINVNPNQPIEKYIVEQLIAGPQVQGHQPTIPADTKIREINTEDGVCYVNLSMEFISKHPGGATEEALTLYSIVDSLTELSNIKKVSFLIESERVDNFKGAFLLSKPFERNTDIIEKNTEAEASPEPAKQGGGK